MKLIIILIFTCLLLIGCGSDNSTSKPSSNATHIIVTADGNQTQSETQTQPVTESDTDTDTDTDTEIIDRLINSANAESILRQVASIVNEDPIEEFMQAWHTPFGGVGHWIGFELNNSTPLQTINSGDLLEPVTVDFINFWEEPISRVATEFTDYSCIRGGTVKQLTEPYRFNLHILDDCATSSGTHSGEALRMISNLRPFHAIGHYRDLKIIDSRQMVSTLTGRFRDGGNQSFIVEDYSPEWIGVEYTSTQNSEPFKLTRFNIARNESNLDNSDAQTGDFRASVKSGFGVSAHWSQQAEFSVEVNLSLFDPASAFTASKIYNWDTGLIDVTAPDGSSMKIEIDAANPTEFTIILENNESIGPFQWSDGFKFEFSRWF